MLKGALPESTIKLTFGVVCMKIVAHAKGKKGERESQNNVEITLNINNFHTATRKNITIKGISACSCSSQSKQ